MNQVEIYTKGYCPYCQRAKELLQSKNVPYLEYDVSDDPAKEQEMRQRSGRQTVPEIFINDTLVGGCDDLFALEATGTLDSRLSD
jgi:glutaredoxin 3